MSAVESFPPIVAPGARVLILGSMPGVASLSAGQYYAHPRNAFWRILGASLGFAAGAPYAERVAGLQAGGAAVWDVLRTCVRPGSLDAAIERSSEVPNDVVGLLAEHPSIRRVCFNGGTAAAAFRRHVSPERLDAFGPLDLRALPSTSPANASWSFERKLAAWSAALKEQKMEQQFASDNYAGICPEALAALTAANAGHAPAYGEDEWTRRVSDRLRALFETDCDVYFAFNGTAANSLALASLCQSYHSVICHELAHVDTDECGGPEFFSNGSKLLPAKGEGGKLTPAAVEEVIARRSDIHYPKPRVVTLTQATEVGTVYRPAEVAAIAELAHARGLRVHMDGARFANAVASLGTSPADVTWRAGVDVLCFGGTKMGLPVGEAVVFFDRRLSEDFAYRCKQAGQLASKMRFLSAPWLGMLEGDVWLHHARHANTMARRLADGLATLPGAKLLFPVEANGVFAELPAAAIAGLRARGWRFYTFIGAGGARFMCAWDTTPARVDALLADLLALVS